LTSEAGPTVLLVSFGEYAQGDMAYQGVEVEFDLYMLRVKEPVQR